MDGIPAAGSYAVIAAAAVFAPILADLVRRPRIPGVLFELLLGIAIGPQVLGWAEITPLVDGLAHIGIAFLFLVAGFEIDFTRLRGVPARLAITGWSCSLALGLVVGGVLVAVGFALSGLLIGLVLTTTAVGTLLPILRDRGTLATPFGGHVLAAGAVGEFAPIIAITLLLSGTNPVHEAGLLVAFVVVAVVAAWAASRPQPPSVVATLHRHVRTSSQLPIRIVVLALAGMVLLASELGLDTLLGAFAAGIVLRLAFSETQREELEPRLSGLGFGFLIPVFFIASGMRFDVDALTSDHTIVLRVALFFTLFLAVRGLPALLIYRNVLTAPVRSALAFLQATALPLVVVITEIGLSIGHMKPANATALVGAAMLSVLVFPIAGYAFAARARDDEALTAIPDGSSEAIDLDPFEGL